MGYIFIMLLAIVITTVLVFLLVNSVLGIHLRWKPLALCAAASIVISLVLPQLVVGIVGLAGSFGLLALLAVLFAYFITKYDAYAERKLSVDTAEESKNQLCDYSEEICGLAQMETAAGHEATESLAENILNVTAPLQDVDQITENDGTCLTEQVEENEAVAFSDSLPAPETELTETLPEAKVQETLIQEPALLDRIAILEVAAAEKRIDSDTQREENIVDVSEELSAVAEESECCGLVAQTEMLDADLENASNKDGTPIDDIAVISEQSEEAAKEETVVLTVPLAVSMAEEQIIVDEESIIITEKIGHNAAMVGEQTVNIESLEKIQSLDGLMDYAFAQKDQKNFQQALAAFRKAFDLYPDSESAPFIIIEMGNILKNRGAYDEAIQIFSEGRNLPALRYDQILEQEFVSTIAYLRIVKNILLAQRLGFIPYCEIPGAVVAEINAEFCEWRNLA